MDRKSTVETRQDRLALAEDAGMGKISPISVLAGVMCAYGTFVLLLAMVAAGLRGAGAMTDFSGNDWRTMGAGAGIVVGGVALVAWLFGGYVAGRMARRAGVTHGVLVFAGGVLIAGAAALLANAVAGSGDIVRNLRTIGIPTSSAEWRRSGTIAGLASLAAMLVGAIGGGGLGERWHARLLARALDPGVGTEADLRRRSDETREQADARRRAARRRVVAARGTAAVSAAPPGATTGNGSGNEEPPTADRPDATDADRTASHDSRDDADTGTVVHRRPRRGLLRR